MTLLEIGAEGYFTTQITNMYREKKHDSNGVNRKSARQSWGSHREIDNDFNRKWQIAPSDEPAMKDDIPVDRDCVLRERRCLSAHDFTTELSATCAHVFEIDPVTNWSTRQLTDWMVNLTHDARFGSFLTDDERTFLCKVFKKRRVLRGFDLHNHFARFRDDCTPVGMDSAVMPSVTDALSILDTVDKVLYASLNKPLSFKILRNVTELRDILSSPYLYEMLLAHDLLSERLSRYKGSSLHVHFQPKGGQELALNQRPVYNTKSDPNIGCPENGSLPCIQREGQHRIVMVRRDDKPLGATIRNEGDAVIVARVLQGGRIQRRDLMREGDQIIAINGVVMHGQDIERVCRLLNEMPGILLFRILPNPLSPKPPLAGSDQPELYLRALFSYSAQTDRFMPCRELGLSFRRGDILRVVDHDDVDWWQAHPIRMPATTKTNSSSTTLSFSSANSVNYSNNSETPEDQLPGLIPSPGFQIRRHRLGATADGATAVSMSTLPRRSSSGFFRRILDRKSRRSRSTVSEAKLTEADETEGPPILTYEAVAPLDPLTLPNRRPLVVVATHGIGRERLVECLIAAHDDHLCELPYKSTHPEDKQQLSLPEFEKYKEQGLLLDCQVHDEYHFGFHIETLYERLRWGKTVVVKAGARDIKFLRVPSIKPYIVFLSPPNDIQALRAIRKEVFNVLPSEESETLLESIIQDSSAVDTEVGHFFDQVIHFSSFKEALQELNSVILKLETERMWVPADWLSDFESPIVV